MDYLGKTIERLPCRLGCWRLHLAMLSRVVGELTLPIIVKTNSNIGVAKKEYL
jgi:hypothetical protein